MDKEVCMASNVRYQIFVSSTYKDLYPVRRKVTEHILSMNHIPAGMEMFSASGREQWKTIQKAIDNSDYYVLIIGEKYGSISEDEGISYTQKEFEYARTKDIPTLCFLPGDDFSTSREHREVEPEKIRLLEEFKRKVLDEQLCDFWVTENELVTKISAALYKIFTEEPGVGWIRGDAVDPNALSKLVKAMEENNFLREKINEMEKALQKDKPTLSLKINDIPVEDNEIVFLQHEPDDLADVKPQLTINDIPITKQFITQMDIDNYNKALPTSDAVDLYNKKLRLYETVSNSKIKLSINNEGYAKANNTSIRIYFPEDVKVLNTSDVDYLKPKELSYPMSPLERSSLDRLMALSSNYLFNKDIEIGSSIANNFAIMNHLREVSDELSRVGHNEIHGQVNFVRQATEESLDPEFYLLFKHRGSFRVKVEILCDEYREWQESHFTVTLK
ncbi:TPA: DUF4062 domain-containing protein [Klebsiella aerogenes]